MADYQKQGIEINLPEQVAEGHYSNLAIISHSPSEFIIDFATALPGLQKANVKSRIILTPEHTSLRSTRLPTHFTSPLHYTLPPMRLLYIIID